MKSVYSEENFEFLVEFIKLQKIQSKEDLVKESARVFGTFVAQNSEKQLNVSSMLRENAEKSFQQDPANIESVYRQINNETRKLILSQLHIQHFQEKMVRNLDKKVFGFTCLCVHILIYHFVGNINCVDTLGRRPLDQICKFAIVVFVYIIYRFQGT
jgi:hypothetical protein